MHCDNPAKISVLVPVYNHEAFLPAALESILAQTYPHWEAIVVNDGSTDNTPGILAQYAARDPRIRAFHKPNGGTASALNEAVKFASGDWLCWLSSDDLFEAEKLEIHARAIAEHPGVKFFHSAHSLLDHATGVKTPNRLPQPRPEYQTLFFFLCCWVHANSFCLHKSVLETAGRFDEDNRNAQDFDMWLRISAQCPLHYLDRYTCISRVHPGQATSLSFETGVYDCLQACTKFLNRNPFPALFPWVDLKDPLAAGRAILELAKLYLAPGGFINSCGYTAAPLERFREWVTSDCSPPAKAEAKSAISRIAGMFSAGNVPAEVKAMFAELANNLENPYRYQPHDFVAEFTAHTAKCLAQGQPERAAVMTRYLANNICYVQGLKQYRAGERARAAELFEQALSLDPQHRGAREKLEGIGPVKGRPHPEEHDRQTGAYPGTAPGAQSSSPARTDREHRAAPERCAPAAKEAREKTRPLRILFVSPPYSRFLGLQNARFPLTFGSMATLLAQRGHVARIYDADFDRQLLGKAANYEYAFTHQHLVREALENRQHPVWTEISETVRAFRPEVIGLTAMTNKFPMALRIARAGQGDPSRRQNCGRRSSCVGAGGADHGG